MVLTVVFRAAARHGVAGELLRMRVCVGGRDVELTALRDTGNGLRDPVGGTPVLVAAPGALDGVLPRRVRQLLGMSLPPADLLEPLRQIAPELRFRADSLPRGRGRRATAGGAQRLDRMGGAAAGRCAGGIVPHGTGNRVCRA